MSARRAAIVLFVIASLMPQLALADEAEDAPAAPATSAQPELASVPPAGDENDGAMGGVVEGDAEGQGVEGVEGLAPDAIELATAFEILDESVLPGTLARLTLRTSESFAGSYVETPVAVVHGREAGDRLCVVAGIHGDEVNGVEVVRRMLGALDPATLRGTVVAVPIANLSAFRRGSRYLPDRRDLNRFFPGRSYGSAASRIAHGLFENVFRQCDALVDLHTGSFQRSNIHQLRAHLGDPATAKLSAEFGASIVVNKAGRTGTLRRAATDVGIPAITVEAGESTRFEEIHVSEALNGILRLLRNRGMLRPNEEADSQTNPTAYLRTRWVRCEHGGILVAGVRLGDPVYEGQVLGSISDPLSDEVTFLKSPIAGRVIGMAYDQVVMPGFAAFHVAYDSHELRPDRLPIGLMPEVASEPGPDELDLEERPE